MYTSLGVLAGCSIVQIHRSTSLRGTAVPGWCCHYPNPYKQFWVHFIPNCGNKVSKGSRGVRASKSSSVSQGLYRVLKALVVAALCFHIPRCLHRPSRRRHRSVLVHPEMAASNSSTKPNIQSLAAAGGVSWLHERRAASFIFEFILNHLTCRQA
eukprot:SAG31_NODE_6584_length_1962_cov_4.170156_1_plen_155_part_00